VKSSSGRSEEGRKTVSVVGEIRNFKDIEKLGNRVSEAIVANWLAELLSGQRGRFVVTISSQPEQHGEQKKKR
jgi:hypothetical protein